jgi:hypothetical protein
MASLLAHQKQYVLGPAAVRVRPDWITAEIAAGLILSHCPKLSVMRLRSRDSQQYHLLGLAVPADAPVSSIAEGISSRDSAEIENWSGCWAGRWLLVSKDRCSPDASCSLGVNYRHTESGLWIANSVALLGEHLPHVAPAPRIPWRIAHEKGMDWIPAPLTTRKGIYKLLPQRTIDPVSGTQHTVRFDPPAQEVGDVAAEFAFALQTILANWARWGFSKLRISLTAGLDTRTVLAAACATQINAQAYTSIYPFTDRADRVLPPRLAALAGIPHTYSKLPRIDPEDVEARRAVIAEHMDGATTHPSFDHFAQHDHGAKKTPGLSSTNGHCFELGRCFFWPRFARVGVSEPRPTTEQVLEAFMFQSSWRPEPIGAWKQAIQSWLDSLSDPVPLAPDWRDRFHLDQRLGSWNANVRRTNDLVDGTALSPANCLWMFDLLLRPEPHRREGGALQKEAIRLMAPRLLDMPINPEPVSTRIKKQAKTFLGPRVIRALKPLAKAMKLR